MSAIRLGQLRRTHRLSRMKSRTNAKRQSKHRQLLGRGALQQLLDEQAYDEIIGRIERIGRMTNLLQCPTEQR